MMLNFVSPLRLSPNIVDDRRRLPALKLADNRRRFLTELVIVHSVSRKQRSRRQHQSRRTDIHYIHTVTL